MMSTFALSDIPHIYWLSAAPPPAFGSLEYFLNSNLVNVLLVALILGVLIKKFNLFAAFDRTQERIASELQAVENQKQQALTQLEEAQRRTANLKAEVEEILQAARQSAEGLSAQIIADARNESTKLIENAKRRVELEQRSSIKELERRLLNEALTEARTTMAQSMTAADQKRSVEAFLAELEQSKGGVR